MLLVTAAIVASALHLQVDTTAGIHGAVMSSFNGRPIAGVMVGALDGGKFTLTDAQGRFALTGLRSGRRTILISFDGRVTEDYLFTLEPQRSKRIAVLLDQDAEDLDPLVVEAQAPNLWRDLVGFYERRETYRGFAHFFTREEISHRHAAKPRGHRDALLRGMPPDAGHPWVALPGSGGRSSTWMGTGRSAGGSCGLVEIWTR